MKDLSIWLPIVVVAVVLVGVGFWPETFPARWTAAFAEGGLFLTGSLFWTCLCLDAESKKILKSQSSQA